ncbi:phage tail protein [Enterococcus faecium]|uniref:phage tail protein n=1 Tax=Enterococcus faecium TaxID=1352 RepID=UPI0039FC4679
MRFGDGYSQRAPAGLNANLKTYSVTLSVPRWEATALESFLAASLLNGSTHAWMR